MTLLLLSLLAGLVLLIVSAERFVFGASALAHNLRVSPLMIGVVIVGFGTSAPELMVSTIAAWQDKSGIAIGNAIGSNITNIGLILGAAALIRPLSVHSQVLRRELPILLAAMLVLLLPSAAVAQDDAGIQRVCGHEAMPSRHIFGRKRSWTPRLR